VALGIERKRTQERLLAQLIESKKAERRLAAEHAVSQILAISSTLSDAAMQLLHAICESLGWDVGELWTVDRAVNVLRCVEIWHTPSLDTSAFEQDTRQRTFAMGIGLPGRVWESGTHAWVADVTVDDTFFPRGPSALRTGLRGAIAIPIGQGHNFLGVMGFFSRDVEQPDEVLIEMLASIGSQISQFIERRLAESVLQREQNELQIASQIQQGLLPKVMPTLAGFEIAGKMATANRLGGDCFDFIFITVGGQKCLLVLVADAAGHGIGSALMIAETRAYLRALSLTCADVDTLLTLVNRRLTDGEAIVFVTALLLLLNPRTRSLCWAGAGHCPGHVLDRRGQSKAVLTSMGTVLGIDQASEFYASPPITLEPGDLVFLYTDGIVEAALPDGPLFGLKRTLDVVRTHQDKTSEKILEILFDTVNNFSQRNLPDDATAVIIKVE
jgi:serine phosphatase RsbU (regulator of sigma subunit)